MSDRPYLKPVHTDYMLLSISYNAKKLTVTPTLRHVERNVLKSCLLFYTSHATCCQRVHTGATCRTFWRQKHCLRHVREVKLRVQHNTLYLGICVEGFVSRKVGTSPSLVDRLIVLFNIYR